MRAVHQNLKVLLFCISCFLPDFHFQVPGFGTENSIGQTPYPPSSFYPTETWGVNNAYDNRWPNGIIPYTFDYTSSNPADNITLSMNILQLTFPCSKVTFSCCCLCCFHSSCIGSPASCPTSRFYE